MPLRALVPAAATLSIVVAAALLLGPSDAQSAASWTWPVAGEVLTEYRNGDDPYASGQHRGIDIAAPVGTPVVAAAAGTVRFRGVAGANGLTVSIRTADARFDTSYLHLASATVVKGQVVRAGEPLGTVGASGRRSAEAPHLHFGVREAGSRHAYLDPRSLLGPLSAPAPAEPRGAPVPVEVPVPVAPAPVPVAEPVRSPLRLPDGVRVRVPGARRVRVPAARRVRVPRVVPSPSARVPERARVPAAALHPAAVPSVGAAPATAPRPGPVGQRSPASPRLGPEPGPGAVTDTGPARASTVVERRAMSAEAARPEATTPGRRGPDLGWAVACTGLLLAAACLGGRPGEARGEPRPRVSALRSLLNPLTGGR